MSLRLPNASATLEGTVSTGTQTFAGIKNNASMPAFCAPWSGASIPFYSADATVALTGAFNRWSTGVSNGFNQGSHFTNGTGTDGGKFIVPTGGAGIYSFTCTVKAGALTNESFFFGVMIQVDGVTRRRHDWYAAANCVATMTLVTSLTDGQKVNAAIITNNATNINQESDPIANVFEGYKLY